MCGNSLPKTQFCILSSCSRRNPKRILRAGTSKKGRGGSGEPLATSANFPITGLDRLFKGLFLFWRKVRHRGAQPILFSIPWKYPCSTRRCTLESPKQQLDVSEFTCNDNMARGDGEESSSLKSTRKSFWTKSSTPANGAF